MVVYLELMEVWSRENGWEGVLWLGTIIKVSVTASYIVGKRRTGVFASVFCDARGSMELTYGGGCLRDNSVSLYFLEIPHFSLGKGPKVFKNNVWNIYPASPKL